MRYVAGARLYAGAALKHLDYSKLKKKMEIPARPELPLPAVSGNDLHASHTGEGLSAGLP